MKNLFNLGKVLKKEEQKAINGGIMLSACGGCSDDYLCPNQESTVCVFPDGFGNNCFGTYTSGGPCCV